MQKCPECKEYVDKPGKYTVVSNAMTAGTRVRSEGQFMSYPKCPYCGHYCGSHCDHGDERLQWHNDH